MSVRHDMITCLVARPGPEGEAEFLQLHRCPGDEMGGTWQFIRGGVEPGETSTQAALRELREEAGLAPREFYRLGLVEAFHVAHSDIIWMAPAFLALVGRGDDVILNPEHDEARWIGRSHLPQCMMWASERPLFECACRDILDDGPARPFLRVSI